MSAVPVGTDLLRRMYVQIVLGTPKDQFPWPLDAEASELWDQLAAEVDQALAAGYILEVPS
jgi:hypothetical protein